MNSRNIRISLFAGAVSLALLVAAVPSLHKNVASRISNRPAAVDHLQADGGAPPPTTPKKPSPSFQG